MYILVRKLTEKNEGVESKQKSIKQKIDQNEHYSLQLKLVICTMLQFFLHKN